MSRWSPSPAPRTPTSISLRSKTACGSPAEGKLVKECVESEDCRLRRFEPLLLKNAAALSFLADFSLKSSYRPPELEDLSEYSFESPVTKMASLVQAAGLVCIRARISTTKGKVPQALDDAIRVAQIGQRLQDAQGGAVCYMVGVLLKDMGLRTVRHIVRSAKIPAASLAPLIVRIGAFSDNEEGLKSALKLEYVQAANQIDRLAKGSVDRWPLKTGYHFKPNRTKRLYAEHCRAALAEIGTPCGLLRDPSPKSYRLAPGTLGHLLTENAIGKILFSKGTGDSLKLLNRRCEDDFATSATQILLALKAHSLAAGAAPDSLRELVPGYLPKIPDDPFDGAPMRYSKEKRTVHSVGVSPEGKVLEIGADR